MKHLVNISFALFLCIIPGVSHAGNEISVTYSSDGAQVEMSAEMKGHYQATVDGGHVHLRQLAAGPGLCDIKLSGKSTSGSFWLEGKDNVRITLDGLQLTNRLGAALRVDSVSQTTLCLGQGSDNILQDGSKTMQKGCVMVTGSLRVEGAGNLTMQGNTKHGLWSRGNMEIDINEGKLVIETSTGKGIDVKKSLTLTSGDLDIKVSADAAKGIAAGGEVFVNGGDCHIETSGNGTYKKKKDKTKAAACLSGDSNIVISGGSLDFLSTGQGGKGISGDVNLTVTGGDINIRTTGQRYQYMTAADSASFGQRPFMQMDSTMMNRISAMIDHFKSKMDQQQGTMPNWDEIADSLHSLMPEGGFGFGGMGGMGGPGGPDEFGGNSDHSNSPKGIKIDKDIVIQGGRINVKTMGEGGEGIEAKGELTIQGGDIVVNSNDDAINSGSHMYIKGGNIYVNAERNDGLDSNGNMYIEGGTVVAYGTDMPEGGIDANEEQRYSVIITGGTLVAIGGSNSMPNRRQSTQPSIVFAGDLPQGSTLILDDNDGNNILSFEMQRTYRNGFGGGPGGPFGQQDGEMPEMGQMPMMPQGGMPGMMGDSLGMHPHPGMMGDSLGMRPQPDDMEMPEGMPDMGDGDWMGGPGGPVSGANGTIFITSPKLKAGDTYKIYIEKEPTSEDGWHGLNTSSSQKHSGDPAYTITNMSLPYSVVSGQETDTDE